MRGVEEDRRGEIGPAGKALRLCAIGGVLVVSAGAFAYAGGWLTPGRLTQEKLVAGLETVNGVHPGFRRNHAKGVCATGFFESTGEAAALSKATILAKGRVPVVARIAFAGGMPFVADAPATVRSLALRFTPASGEEWRTGMINIPVFPFSKTADFYEQLLISKPDPATGKPDPAKMQAFVAGHPDFAAAGGLVGKRTVSSGFADATYNALHTFRFVSSNGTATPVRWSTVALDPFAPAAASPPADKNGLFDAFIARMAQRPVQWRLLVTVGGPDASLDPSKPWPEGLRQVDAGTVTLERVEAEDGGPCTGVNYDPLVLPAGIESSGDEILSARSAAYSRSFLLREGEHAQKPPSAVTPQEVSAGGRS